MENALFVLVFYKMPTLQFLASWTRICLLWTASYANSACSLENASGTKLHLEFLTKVMVTVFSFWGGASFFLILFSILSMLVRIQEVRNFRSFWGFSQLFYHCSFVLVQLYKLIIVTFCFTTHVLNHSIYCTLLENIWFYFFVEKHVVWHLWPALLVGNGNMPTSQYNN